MLLFFLIRPGIEPRLLHWKAKSQPPDHQASPRWQEILYWEPVCILSHVQLFGLTVMINLIWQTGHANLNEKFPEAL